MVESPVTPSRVPSREVLAVLLVVAGGAVLIASAWASADWRWVVVGAYLTVIGIAFGTG